MPKRPEIKPGTVFERWTVANREGSNRRCERTYRCVCACGVSKLVSSVSLLGGSSRSCGCYKRDVQRAARTTHGESTSATYRSWHSMLQRCGNPNNKHWGNYGGRGITVCPEWSKFDAFFASLGHQPPGMTLERVENNKGYSPDNCTWATRKEQAANTRAVRRFDREGQMLTIAALAAIAGVKPHTMYCRLVSYKWPMSRACPEQGLLLDLVKGVR